MKIDSQLVQTLEIARETEKLSLKRYLDFAWQNPDFQGKDMFIRLALDEYAHLELIDNLLTVTCSAENCLPQPLPESLVRPLLPLLSNRNRRIQGVTGTDKLNALLAALDAENRARDFYSARAQEKEEPVRGLLLYLADMEQAHADLLQAEIDNIQETGFWFYLREFSLEAER